MNKQNLLIFIMLFLFVPQQVFAKRRTQIVSQHSLSTEQQFSQARPQKDLFAINDAQAHDSFDQIPEGHIPSTQDIDTQTQPPALTTEELTTNSPLPIQMPQSPLPTSTENNQEETADPKDIYLNFENSDLATFVHFVAETRGLNMIPDAKIAGNKISITIREPLDSQGVWNIFQTIMEMSGFTMVKVGDVYKVVQSQNKKYEPHPTYINVSFDKIPKSDETIRFVTFLNNIPADQVKSLLQGMLSQTAQLLDAPNANGFVITDKCYNIRAAMEVLQELDRSDIKQSVTVIRLKQANAKDVQDLFSKLMAKPEGHPLAALFGKKSETSVEYFPPTTKMIAEDRTNSLILMGDPKSIKKIEDFITEYVDTELKALSSPIRIYELKHLDVEKMEEMLEKIVNEPGADSPAGQYGGIRGGVKYFKKMKFKADAANNRLLVSCTDDQDWALLKKTLDDLDKPQPQVALETLIVSVDFEKNKNFGGQIRNKKEGQLGKHINGQAGNLEGIVTNPPTTASSTPPYSLLGDLFNLTAAAGTSILTFGKIGDVWGMLQMFQSEANTTLLSQPFIVTTNMLQATILVGETRRVESGTALADSTGAAGSAKEYEDMDANLKINVTPQINLDGVINLKFNVDINDFSGGTEDRPITTNRNLTTNVSVANGQVLILGGFIKTKIIENTYKTPLLGDVPGLGWLFKYKERSSSKQYIFIFMSPTIVKPRETPGIGLYTKMKLHQATNDIDEAVDVRKSNDPVQNWFFNPTQETYSHKVVDFANARYQPPSVDVENDPYYRSATEQEELKKAEGMITHSQPTQSHPLPNQPQSASAPIIISPQVEPNQNTTPTSFHSSEVDKIAPTTPTSKAKTPLTSTLPLQNKLVAQTTQIDEPNENNNESVGETVDSEEQADEASDTTSTIEEFNEPQLIKFAQKDSPQKPTPRDIKRQQLQQILAHTQPTSKSPSLAPKAPIQKTVPQKALQINNHISQPPIISSKEFEALQNTEPSSLKKILPPTLAKSKEIAL